MNLSMPLATVGTSRDACDAMNMVICPLDGGLAVSSVSLIENDSSIGFATASDRLAADVNCFIGLGPSYVLIRTLTCGCGYNGGHRCPHHMGTGSSGCSPAVLTDFSGRAVADPAEHF